MEKALINTLQISTVIDKLFGEPRHRDARAAIGPHNECIVYGHVCGSLTFMVYEQESNYIAVFMASAPDNKFDWISRVTYACANYNNNHFKVFEDELYYGKEETMFAGYRYTYFRM